MDYRKCMGHQVKKFLYVSLFSALIKKVPLLPFSITIQFANQESNILIETKKNKEKNATKRLN